ncbi:MAG TPA: DUF3810 family protein, partial [Mobilitalea sp.]|nr:DUF3810 family protein [Mobilitalea sp.]
MKTIFKLKRIYLLGLIPISILFIFLAKNSSFFAEDIYALHVYKWISQILSTITGILPFSLAEVLVILLPVTALVILIRFIILMIAVKEGRLQRFFRGILNVLCTASVILFLFTMFGGLNYYRYPFSYYSNLTIQNSSVDELYALTKSLALQANDLRAQIPKTDANGVFQLAESNQVLA